MTELRRHVERIIRPIRASGIRKMRMRDELLGHLTRIYEEELAGRQNDENGALAAAAGRFGDPTTLRAELQATVPWIERVMCAPLPRPNSRFARRPGESVIAYVRRTAVWATTINALTWAVFVAALVAIGPRRAHEARPGGPLLMVLAYVLLFPLLLYGPMLLIDRAARAWGVTRDANGRLVNRAGLRAAGFVAATMSIYVAATFLYLSLLTYSITIPIVSDFWFWSIVLGAGLIALPITALQIRDLRRWELWEGLALDDEHQQGVSPVGD